VVVLLERFSDDPRNARVARYLCFEWAADIGKAGEVVFLARGPFAVAGSPPSRCCNRRFRSQLTLGGDGAVRNRVFPYDFRETGGRFMGTAASPSPQHDQSLGSRR
jgi:hypothetical protein